MSAWGTTEIGLAVAGAAVLFLLDLAYSTIIVAMSALSRVALHRMAADAPSRHEFLQSLRDPQSSHRIAVTLMRQFCLLGGVCLSGLAARGAGLLHPGVIGVLVGTLVGVLFLEAGLARLLALWEPRSAIKRLAFLIRFARAVLLPVVQPLHLILTRAARSQEVTDEEREEQGEEEVEAFIEVGEREGILEASEGEMMRGIVDLDETRVREIMTPRTDIVALPLETTIADARRAILKAGHSRMPVYRETIDNVVGVLHERDLLRAWEEGSPDPTISRYLREAMFVPEPLSAAQLLTEMRVKTHLALVVDEYGGIAGLVTLEDLLEEIVGDIRDEHDDEEALLRQESEGCWLVNAAAHVDELSDLFGVDFEERDFDTVGGLVVSRLGRVPGEGESLDVDNLQIEVVKADPRRIRQVRIRERDAPDEARAKR